MRFTGCATRRLATDARPAFTREYAGRPVRFLTLDPLMEQLA